MRTQNPALSSASLIPSSGGKLGHHAHISLHHYHHQHRLNRAKLGAHLPSNTGRSLRSIYCCYHVSKIGHSFHCQYSSAGSGLIHFIYFHNNTNPLSSSVHSFLSQHHIPLQQSSAIILGAPIGATIHDIQALATLMLKDQMLVLQTLLHDAMPIQEALLLLRTTHKLDYLLRCVPPSAMKKLAVDFDGQLMDAFIKKTDIRSQLDRPGVDPVPILDEIASPVAAGGFGVTRSQDIMNIAYVSSLAATIQSAKSIQSFAAYNNTDNVLSNDSALYHELTSALAIVHQQISPISDNNDNNNSNDNNNNNNNNDNNNNNNNNNNNDSNSSSSRLLPNNANDFITSFNQPLSLAKFSTYGLQSRLIMKAQNNTSKASLSAVRDLAHTTKTKSALITYARRLAITAVGACLWGIL